MTDEAIRKLEAEGQAALAELFDENRERLRRMVDMRLDPRVARRIDPSDVLQEAFLDAVKGLDQYVQGSPMSFFLWLRLVTGQRLMQIHRYHLGAQRRDSRREVPIDRPAIPSANSFCMSGMLLGRLTSPSLAACRDELRVQLQEAIDAMEPIEREILCLRHYEELSNQEVAEELGISIQAASKRYIRALEKLRGQLSAMPGFEDYLTG